MRLRQAANARDNMYFPSACDKSLIEARRFSFSLPPNTRRQSVSQSVSQPSAPSFVRKIFCALAGSIFRVARGERRRVMRDRLQRGISRRNATRAPPEKRDLALHYC